MPPDSSEPTRPTRRRRTWWGVYSVVVLLIASFAGWSTATVLEVDRLRDRLALNVGWLVELQEIQLGLAQADGAAAEAVVRARLQSLATQIADTQSQGDAGLVSLQASRGSPPSRAAMVEATDGLIRDLRDDNAAASRRIGAHWGSMSLIVIISLALAMGVLVLLDLIRRRARKLASLGAELGRRLEERRQVLLQLEASRQRFALAAAVAHDGVWDWDLAAGTLWMSGRCAELFGLPGDEGEHTPSAWFDRIDPEDRARVQAAVDDHVSAGDEPLDVEYRVPVPGSASRWVSTRGLALREGTDIAHRIVGSHSDITRTREMERLKNQFVAAVSHELRTPLTAIMGALALAVDGRAGDISDDARQLLKLARRNGDRLLRLVNDIVDSQRLAERRVGFTTERLDLVGLCARTLEECQGFATPAEVELRFEAEEAEVWVVTDPARIAQVVTNLVSNAVKFSPPEEVVALRVSTRRGRARVEVRDRGPGIPADDIDRIFERFVKASGRATQNKPGAGLGLTISKSIVEALGGQIGVRSDPGEGSSFYFEFPLSLEPVRVRADNEGSDSAADQIH